MLPNDAEKIGGPRYRPDRRFGMSEETSGHRLRHLSSKRSEMRESSETGAGEIGRVKIAPIFETLLDRPAN